MNKRMMRRCRVACNGWMRNCPKAISAMRKRALLSRMALLLMCLMPLGAGAGIIHYVSPTGNLFANPQVWTTVTGNIVGLGIPRTIEDPVPGTNRACLVRVELAP